MAAENAVALGAGSIAEPNTVSVGSPGAERRIANVAAGIAPTDAVNVGQLTTVAQSAALAQSGAGAAQATANAALAGAAAAQTTADAAQSTANTALTNAATAQSTANTALANAATAQTTAEGAQVTANAALVNAATAQATANTAQSTASTALVVANQAQATSASNSVQIAGLQTVTSAHSTQISALQAGQTQLGTQLNALQAAHSSLAGRVDTLFNLAQVDRRDARQGIAAAVAMGNAPMPSAEGRTSYVLNVATFRGEQAVGGAITHRLDVGTPFAVTAGFSYSGNRNNAARVGVAGEF